MFDSNFKVIKNAKVEVSIIENKKEIHLMISVENQMPYVFERGRKENKMIMEMDLSSIKEHFEGGTFVFLADDLIDYRVGNYSGYVRSEDNIKELTDILGCEKMNNGRRGVSDPFNQFRRNTVSSNIFLGGSGKEFELEIEGMGEGGVFKNTLIHKWNPFNPNVIVSLETERLICTNGMVGMSPFVTNEVPIINRVTEHLDLVSVQLAPQINSVLKDRFSNMSKNPASLNSMISANGILTDRLKDDAKKTSGFYSEESDKTNNNAKLVQMKSILNVKKNLSHVYEDSVYESKELTKSLSGNITQFDLFNILTEAFSHTNGKDANNLALQRDINKIVFDELNDKKAVQGKIPLSSDSDHKRAFFGNNN